MDLNSTPNLASFDQSQTSKVIPIPLTRGYHALVDEQDYERISQFKWRANVTETGLVYAVRGRARHTVYMHRFILDENPSGWIDHKDGDGLHNWRSNLRISSPAGNARNRRKKKGTASRYKGVTRRSGKWAAQIGSGGNKYRLGSFQTEEQAAEAYNAAAIKLYGEFARLNIFPPKEEQ